MLLLAPTPSPIPTVTVTQTVVVPTSLPTPIVNMPPDSVGWPTLLDGFLGAFLGVLASAYIAWRLVRRETKIRNADSQRQETEREEDRKVQEQIRLDERRRDRAERLALAFRQLAFTVPQPLPQGISANIAEISHAASALLAMLDEQHTEFREWLTAHLAEMAQTWALAARALPERIGKDQTQAKMDLMYWALTVGDHIGRWGADPRNWKPITVKKWQPE